MVPEAAVVSARGLPYISHRSLWCKLDTAKGTECSLLPRVSSFDTSFKDTIESPRLNLIGFEHTGPIIIMLEL